MFFISVCLLCWVFKGQLSFADCPRPFQLQKNIWSTVKTMNAALSCLKTQ